MPGEDSTYLLYIRKISPLHITKADISGMWCMLFIIIDKCHDLDLDHISLEYLKGFLSSFRESK